MPRDNSKASSSSSARIASRDAWKQRRGAPLRPRDLLAKPKPPREPATAAEILVAALLDDVALGLESLQSGEPLENIALTVQAHETKGAVDGIFQDPSIYRLRLTLEPVMFQRRLELVVDEFEGDEDMNRAPTWLKQLARMRGRRAQFVREYRWFINLIAYVSLTPGILEEAQAGVWLELADYISRIKAVFDEAARPRVPPELRPKPRPRRSGNELIQPMAHLSLRDHDADSTGCDVEDIGVGRDSLM